MQKASRAECVDPVLDRHSCPPPSLGERTLAPPPKPRPAPGAPAAPPPGSAPPPSGPAPRRDRPARWPRPVLRLSIKLLLRRRALRWRRRQPWRGRGAAAAAARSPGRIGAGRGAGAAPSAAKAGGDGGAAGRGRGWAAARLGLWTLMAAGRRLDLSWALNKPAFLSGHRPIGLGPITVLSEHQCARLQVGPTSASLRGLALLGLPRCCVNVASLPPSVKSQCSGFLPVIGRTRWCLWADCSHT